MAGKIKEISAKNFDREVLQAGCAVVDFYSGECPSCEALAAKLESLSLIYGDDVKFVKIFRQKNRALAESLKVRGSPTVLFYQQGRMTGDRLSGGIRRADLIKNLDHLLAPEKVDELKKQIVPAKRECQVLILGGGPGGLSAAIYAGQAGIDTVLVDIALPGGQVSATHQISNYPGFIEPQPGFMLSHYMGEQAKAAGVEFITAVDVSDVDLDNKELLVDGFKRIRAEKIILATGSSAKPLGIKGELEYKGQGVSYSTACDARYYKGEEVIVIGGGNTAIEEALFITRFARKVKIIHQFAELQANKQTQAKAFGNRKIDFIFEHDPREFIKGDGFMEVVIEDLKSGEFSTVRASGIFVFAGMKPNLDFIDNSLKRDQWGYLETDERMHTNLPDVFAVGDVRSKEYRQITTSVSDGTIAAMVIASELEQLSGLPNEFQRPH